MNRLSQETIRILTIDPTYEGFGFTVFEGPQRLVDWGVKTAKSNTNAQCLRSVATLLEHYTPDLIVIEDLSQKCSRRGRRAKVLLGRIARLAAERDIEWRRISRLAVRQTFAQFDATTKDQIAKKIATDHFPELTPWLPRPRKPWQSKGYNMSIFDAATLAFAFFALKTQRQDENSTKRE